MPLLISVAAFSAIRVKVIHLLFLNTKQMPKLQPLKVCRVQIPVKDRQTDRQTDEQADTERQDKFIFIYVAMHSAKC